MPIKFTGDIVKDLKDGKTPYLFHFYVHSTCDLSGLTEASDIDISDPQKFCRILKKRCFYQYHLSEDYVNRAHKVCSNKKSVYKAYSKLYNAWKNDKDRKDKDKSGNPLPRSFRLNAAKMTTVANCVKEMNATEGVRKFFEREKRKDYPDELYVFENSLYAECNKRRYYYVPLFYRMSLVGFWGFVFADDKEFGRWDEVEEYLKGIILSGGSSFQNRVDKLHGIDERSFKSWLCKSLLDVALLYGCGNIRKDEDDVVLSVDESEDKKCPKCSTEFELPDGKKLKVCFDVPLGENFCGPSDKLPFRLNSMRRVISILQTEAKARADALLYATKSAIGSIMSRNGSHNIGSHVLAAMSHRLSNQFDNQTLYHYIQDRMAYVAMAATDFPTWRQPTLVYNQLLNGFFAQRQLLRHISESEGFSDFVVVKPGEALPKALEKGKIYFAVTGCTPDSDLNVAIPGGVVGNHAFYTILENIIRNAAKHEKPRSLVVHIKAAKQGDRVEFSVWTSTGVNKDKEAVEKYVNLIHDKMQEGLLRGDGSLRRGNWGLSEMRISAAFLAGDEKHIIHLDDIVPCVGGDKKNGYGLGYEFSIEKPKELLVVKKDDSSWVVADDTTNGIKVISLEKLKTAKTVFPYSYVLFEDKVECKEKLPLRVLKTSEIADYAKLNGAKLLSAVCDAWKKKVVRERLVDKSLNVTVNLTGDDAGIVTSDSDDSERLLFILTDPSFDDLPHRFNAYHEALDRPIDDIDALDGIWHLRSDAVILRAVKEELGGGNKYIANVLAKALCKAQKLANSNLKCSEDTLRKFLIFLKRVIFAELQTTEATTSVQDKGSKTFKVSNGEDVLNARFIRHGSANKGDYYFESLSGAKNTFSLFRDYVSKKAGAMFEARLVETAALKILVADERVHDYVLRHPEMNDVLEKMHIKVIDKAPRIKDIKNLDIAIIHLGVIDKHLKGNSTQKNVKAYIDRLEKSKRTDVILTTGRGHPDNIPESARVLPYPTVDHTLLQSHPDKMTLLDAVLRVLPGKGGR